MFRRDIKTRFGLMNNPLLKNVVFFLKNVLDLKNGNRATSNREHSHTRGSDSAFVCVAKTLPPNQLVV